MSRIEETHYFIDAYFHPLTPDPSTGKINKWKAFGKIFTMCLGGFIPVGIVWLCTLSGRVSKEPPDQATADKVEAVYRQSGIDDAREHTRSEWKIRRDTIKNLNKGKMTLTDLANEKGGLKQAIDFLENDSKEIQVADLTDFQSDNLTSDLMTLSVMGLQLKYLSLPRIITPDQMALLFHQNGMHFGRVERLDLSQCTQLTQASLAHLEENVSPMIRVDLPPSSDLKNPIAPTIVLQLNNGQMHLGDYLKLFDSVEAALQSLGDDAKELKQADLSSFESKSLSKDIKTICDDCPYLEFLTLPPQATPEQMASIFDNAYIDFFNLKVLDLSSCTHLTDRSIALLTTLPSLIRVDLPNRLPNPIAKIIVDEVNQDRLPLEEYLKYFTDREEGLQRLGEHAKHLLRKDHDEDNP